MKKVKLKLIEHTAPKKFVKEETKKEFVKLKFRFDELQNLLYAQSKYSLLVVLQGMDASGKDGAIKNVFEPINPAGCRVVSFKAPTEIEKKHDFLWRIHSNVPEKGMIHVFNRSHYEDVLIQRVHKWIDEKTVFKRFNHINNFEQLLVDSSTVVLKFFLHVSKEEQLLRLQERMSDPTKKWKYNENDIKEREYWDDYEKAYEDVFENCSEASPWHIVPADQNWYKEYFILKHIVDALENLKMKFPEFKKQ